MPHEHAVLHFESPTIERSEVLRYMGYHGQKYSDEISQDLETQMQAARDISKPAAVADIFDVDTITEDPNPQVTLKDTSLVLKGKGIVKHLKDAKQVGVFAATLGMTDERELRRLALTNNLGQIFFDAASTALIERVCDEVEAHYVSYGAEHRLYTNWRFSPGYGDLPLATQPTLLAALNAQSRIGISLSPSLLMTPTKSVTAIIGFFTEPQCSSHLTCAGCVCRDFCSLRERGVTCYGR
ncbi:MAG: hypothetical protein DUD39_06940 [Coriobacteriaceae bacterium]|nr:MAG: hypothetical protein DUD39_06940 [Coriobacteriaceae bacterium]